MKLIIDIPEEMYAQIINEDGIDTMLIPYKDIIKNGIPLDKIRAEIENIEEGITSYHNDRPWVFKDEVLEVIDKYTGVSE